MIIQLVFILLIALFIAQCTAFKLHLEPNIIANDFIFPEAKHLLKNISYSLPTLEVCFGLPHPQCFDLIISTTSPFLTIESSNRYPFLNHQYDFNKSIANNQTRNTVIHYNFLYLSDYRIIGNSSRDSVTIPSISSTPIANDFTIVTLTERERKIGFTMPMKHIPLDGYIGLSKNCYSLGNYNLSLINYLFNNKVIHKENYALKYNGDGSGEFYLGETYERTTTAMCEPNPNYKWNDWDCVINTIQIGNKSYYNMNKTIIFDSAKQYIEVGDDGVILLDAIRELYLDQCNMKYNHSYFILVCNRSIDISSLPNIVLKIKKIELVLEWKNIIKETMIEGELKYVSMLIVKSSKNKNEPWMFGIPMFIDRVIVFDYELRKVGFANQLYLNTNSTMIRTISFYSIVFLIGGIVLLLYARYSIRK